MGKILEWMEASQKKAFSKYEVWYFAFYELNRIEEKTFAQKFLQYYAVLYLAQFEFKRSLISRIRTEMHDRWARKELEKFYATHKPPYSKEEQATIIAMLVGSKQGRKMLADAMLEPLRVKNAAV